MQSLSPAVVVCLVSLAFATGSVAAQEKIPKAALAALEASEKLELYSLDPKEKSASEPNDFHGWEILGSANVEKAETQKKLIDALKRGVAESDGTVAACFNPRHGIRVVRDGKTFDFVICFECLSAVVFIDDKRTDSFLLTSSPAATFNHVLKDAKVKLPKPADAE
jgi:hypothetical protein